MVSLQKLVDNHYKYTLAIKQLRRPGAVMWLLHLIVVRHLLQVGESGGE